jgi:hypothetical protein
MDSGILGLGNTRSQENEEYNKQVSIQNERLSRQIGDVQKQQKKIDTSDTDFSYAMQYAGSGITGAKTLKTLGKQLTATTTQEALESAGKLAEKEAGKGIGLAELGEGLGIFEGAKAGIQDIEGKWSKMNTGQKISNVADIVGGVADTAAVALPFLAPVAASVGVVSDVIGDIAGEIGDDKAEKAKKQGQLNTQIKNLKAQKLQYQSSPVYSQIGLIASPMHNTAKITGSYGF